jgi:protein PsiE
MKDKIDQLGDILIETFHVVGLFVVGVTIVWSATHEYLIIMQHESGFTSLKNILF